MRTTVLALLVTCICASSALAQDDWQQDERQREERVPAGTAQAPSGQDARFDGGDRMFTLERQALFTSGVGVDDLPETLTPGGVIVMVGGGVTHFTSQAVRRFTDVGGAWDVRVLFPSRLFVSGELAYVGSAQGIDALGLDADATLISNGIEATLRLNILPGMVQPYVFGGIGWRYFDIVNTAVNDSAIANDDHVGVLPMGAGVMARFDRLILDGRGTFRVAFDDEMFGLGPGEGGNMHTWAAELRVGAEI